MKRRNTRQARRIFQFALERALSQKQDKEIEKRERKEGGAWSIVKSREREREATSETSSALVFYVLCVIFYLGDLAPRR